MAFLELQGVEKYFGTLRIIKGVDLTIEKGEFVVFVGPSGCGKSTLLRMIAGLDRDRRRQPRARRPRHHAGCLRPSATWRWCSRATRCTRT